ncbi:MAG: transposase [Thiotrichaceae bacterium]|nr:transposase [Thiotrichaceae bacterium]
MAKFIQGKLYSDKSYISKALKQNLKSQGVELMTSTRKNIMRPS